MGGLCVCVVGGGQGGRGAGGSGLELDVFSCSQVDEAITEWNITVKDANYEVANKGPRKIGHE